MVIMQKVLTWKVISNQSQVKKINISHLIVV